MFESLGARLRELREAQNLSLEQLYARTKILPKYIEALENGRWDLLPGQMYVKPFVKSLSDALGADYKELYSLIDKQKKPEIAPLSPLPVEKPAKERFDYRWIVASLLVIFAVAVIIVFQIFSQGKRNRGSSINIPVVEHNTKGYFASKKYSTKLDFPESILSATDYRYLEITAADSVNLKLFAGKDTLFSGMLPAGKTIKHKSTKPFVLDLQKSDCLDITLDGRKMNQSDLVKYKKYIVFPGSESAARKLSGTGNENK
jgi:transcriptional regulator with XRE-family HTH domain